MYIKGTKLLAPRSSGADQVAPEGSVRTIAWETWRVNEGTPVEEIDNLSKKPNSKSG
jgi:hypothetical protein